MKLHRAFLGIAASVLALAIAGPALAATSGGTTATLTVSGGTLAITVPVNAGNLGTVAESVSPGTITGPLGQVVVSDARGDPAGSGWVASVISTAFTNASAPNNTIIPTAISYTAGPITKVGTAVYTANDPTNLTGAVAAVTATAITGDNSATWDPTITIVVPGGSATGSYAATITHSVL